MKINLPILALFFIFIVFISFTYLLVNEIDFKKMQSEIDDYDKSYVAEISDTFEDYIDKANETAFLLDFFNYAPINKSNGEINYNEIDKIYRHVSNITNSVDYYSHVIVFFDKASIAITEAGTYNINRLFDEIYYNIKYSTLFWKNYASSNHPLVIIPSSAYKRMDSGEDSESRNLLAILPSTELFVSDINVLIFLDETELYKNIYPKENTGDPDFVILDTELNMIVNTIDSLDSAALKEIVDEIDFRKKESSFVLNNEKYNVYLSDKHGLVTINKILHRKYMGFSFLKILKSLAISLAWTAFIYLLFRLTVIKELSFLLKRSDGSSISSTENIYKSLKDNIRKQKDENLKLKSDIDALHRDSLNYLLSRSIFVEGDEIACADFLEKYSNVYPPFVSYRIAILIYHLENGYHKDVLKDLNSLSSSLQKNTFDYFSHNLPGSLTVNIDCLGFALFLPENDNPAKSDIVQFVNNYLKEFTEINKKMNLSVGLSSECFDINLISKAYTEADSQIKLSPVSVKNTVFALNKKATSARPVLNGEDLEIIENLLNKADSTGCAKHVYDILDANYESGISYYDFNVICRRLLDAILYNSFGNKIIHSVKRNEMINKLNIFNSLSDVRLFFENVITDVIKTKDAEKYSKKQSKIEYITEYINLHYNEDLFLENMAQLINTTPKYFSKYFKKETNTSFIEYLNKIRLLHSKELLKKENLMIKDIALLVGFKSNSSFSNAFSHSFGLSPIEYRKKHMGVF